MLPDAISQRSRPFMFAPNTRTQKGSDKWSDVSCFPNTARSNMWVYQGKYLFLASEIMKGRNIT